MAGIKEGMRSGLLSEVERLLVKARTDGTLPKYLLLENVKNLVGRQFRADFEKWITFLSSLGYTTYWQILNAKHYGIPQNRERVFAVSILGGHEPYVFPEKRELKLRLRDMIDDEVDEKYYLTEKALNGILNSAFERRRRQIENGDVCNALTARDYKEPQCVRVGELSGGKWDKLHEHCRRVYAPDGIAPTVHCAGGGNTELKIVDDLYKDREPRVYGENAPTLRNNCGELKVTDEETIEGISVIAGQFQPVDRDYNNHGAEREERFECRRDELSNAVLTGDRKNCVKIVAMRGRDKEGGGREQRLEPNGGGTSNALKTVQKDNLLMECPYILKADAEAARTVRVGGRGDTGRHCWNVIQIKENTKQGCAAAAAGDGVNIQFPTSKTRRGRVGKGVSNTLTCGEGSAVVTDDIRIRKLTPRECLRLMGWTDAQIDRVQAAGVSNAQQYKQAGNGIVVQVLEALLGRLFFYLCN